MDQAPKPAFLVLGQIFSLFASAMILVLLLAAPFDAGSFSINGQEVSGPEFLEQVGWLFGAVGVLLATIGIGLLRDAPWSRPLMLVYWLFIPLSLLLSDPIGASDIAGVSVFTALGAGVAWWYLYRKSNVRAYFDSREVRSRRVVPDSKLLPLEGHYSWLERHKGSHRRRVGWRVKRKS